ncbi:membrane protein [Chryseobacterium sp. Alg-005]
MLLLLLTVTMSVKAQREAFKKGSVMIFWGWNRGWFSDSDIRFYGQDYNFTLKNVSAHDRPTSIKNFSHYINPTEVFIPQVNYHITYFVKDNLGITLGLDHMKYVMDQDQAVEFEGYVKDPKYAAMVNDGKINLSDGQFLKYEHTNGLNYLNLGVQKYKQILNKNKFDIFWTYGLGAGVLIPKTDATLMGKEESDHFHLAGFGMDARTGINIVLWNHIVAKADFKYGYINLPSVRTTQENVKIDKATQDFTFGELVFGIGYTFNTKKHN